LNGSRLRADCPALLAEVTKALAEVIGPDVTVEDRAPIWLVTCHTCEAAMWVAENVQDCHAYWIGDSLVADHRTASMLLSGMVCEGFNVKLG
jgi:hypothetical protein